MQASLTLIDNSTTQDREAEDRLVEQALAVLDQRYFTRGEYLSSPASVASYLKLQLASHPHEVFGMVCLDSRLRVLSFDKLFFGSIDGASVYPREVVTRALVHNAACVVFCHNHPSGCNEPSQADRTLTLRLRDALALVEVRVVDHFIIGAGEPLSMADNGWI